jgi:hypothetical protein
MIVQHPNKTHEATCIAAEGTRQQEVAAAAGNQSAVRTAEIKFYRALVASAVANGQPSAQFSIALRDLGTGGV